MPRNGSGTYIPPASSWNPGVNGVTATTDDFNALLVDLSAAVTQSVSSDGQTPMTGNLPMGNNKITGLANGTANTDAAAFGQISRYAGNCRLTKSGANLLLSPFNGNQLTINGVIQTVPSAGVTLSPTGTPGTTYYIYAYMVGTTMTLENSTTAYAVDVTTGMPIKSGDPTRTLVGMARPVTGPAWQDSADQRLVVSWFNKQILALRAASGVLAPFAGSTPTELNNLYRSQWLHWANQQPTFALTGTAFNSTSPNTVVSTISLDGTTTLAQQTLSEPLNNGAMNISMVAPIAVSPSEGYHYVTFLASVSGGTGSWTADCFTSGQVQG